MEGKKTAKQRQKEYRERIKLSENHEDFRKKQQARSQKNRDKYKAKLKKLPEKERLEAQQKIRKQNNDRLKKFRRLEKEKKDALFPYTSNKVLGKDLKKAKKSLPKSPSKQAIILKQLCGKLNETATASSQTSEPENSLRKTVREFYESDDISRNSPRARDVKYYKDVNGERVLKSRRYLMYTIGETHALFRERFPNLHVGDTSFYYLKPDNVELVSQTPVEMCLCDEHENVRFCTEALESSNSIFVKYRFDFNIAEKFVCEEVTENCWKNRCSRCKNVALIKQFVQSNSSILNLEAIVTWTQWRRITKKNRQEQDNIHIQIKKENVTAKLDDLLKRFYALIPSFVWHSHVLKNQQLAYQNCKQSTEDPESNNAMIHVDFAENFKAFDQDQPQAAHFSQAQISIFTTAIWHRGNCSTKAFVSDCTKHDKNFVVPALEKICAELPSTVHRLEIFSDNARSQFKSKFIMNYLKNLRKKFTLEKISWNFLCEKHGKGVVDGVGATVKFRASKVITARQATVKNAEDFTTVCRGMATEVTEIKADTIDSQKAVLSPIFEASSTIKDISKMYYFSVDQSDKLVTHLLT
jgi:hypothetical protein